MPQTWGPTGPGKLFTSAKPWSLVLDRDQFVLNAEGRRHTGSVVLLEGLTVAPGAFWATVCIAGVNGQSIVLDGIPNDAADKMLSALTASIGVVRRQQQIAKLIGDFGPEVERVRAWVADAKRACSQQLQSRGCPPALVVRAGGVANQSSECLQAPNVTGMGWHGRS